LIKITGAYGHIASYCYIRLHPKIAGACFCKYIKWIGGIALDSPVAGGGCACNRAGPAIKICGGGVSYKVVTERKSVAAKGKRVGAGGVRQKIYTAINSNSPATTGEIHG